MNSDLVQHILKSSERAEFKPDKGLFGATTLGVGALLGAGVYVLIGLAASSAGPGLWLSYVLCGALTVLTVMVYSDFAREKTASGGGYYYAYSQLGSFWGFIVGWHLAVGSIFACALYAFGFASYVTSLSGIRSVPDWEIKLISAIAIFSLVLMGLRGSKGGDLLGKLFTWANVTVLVTIAVIGAMDFDTAHFENSFPSGISGVGGAISLIYISFFGFQLVANNAEEVRDSKTTVPRAMKLSLLIAFLVYLVVAVFAVGAVGADALASSDVPLVLVAQRRLGTAGLIFIALGGVLASAAALNSTLISQSRQIFAMGRDGMLPKLLGAVTKKRGQPAAAMAAGGLATVLVTLFADVTFIAESANFAILFAMLPVCFGLHRLYATSEKKVKKWKRAVPFVALGANGALLATLDMEALTFGLGLFGIGCGVFLMYSRTAEVRMRAGISISLDEKRNYLSLLTGANRILVPVSNPDTIETLFKISKALLPPHLGEIVALRIARTAEGTHPYSHLRKQLEQSEIRAVEQMVTMAKSCDLGIRPLLRATNNPAQGIRHVAVEENCSLIVMGWTAGTGSTPSRFLVDVVTSSMTDFVFLNLLDNRPFKRIGVALGGRDNLAMMVKIASTLAEETRGNVHYFTVLPDDFSARELRFSKVLQREALENHTGLATFHTELLTTPNALETIIAKSKEFDLLLIGSAPPMQSVSDATLIGSFSTKVIEQASCATIVVRRTLGFGRFIPPFIADMFTFERD
ncbi:MAG: amino acid permease [Deltaproteobacteria bacterium]|nr:amino acid permease [Deltaproteobacteria bacterium]